MENRIDAIEADPKPRSAPLGNQSSGCAQKTLDIGPSDVRTNRIGEDRLQGLSVFPLHSW